MMKVKVAACMCSLLILLMSVLPLAARETVKSPHRIKTHSNENNKGGMDFHPEGKRPLFSAHQDTVILGSWTFGSFPSCDPEGWISVDRTEQEGKYFHIENFTGLGGGDFGRLLPLEGNQSLWCGLRPAPGDPNVCRYATLPGYGNNWDQYWCSRCIVMPDTETVFISYLVSWDSETGYDLTYLEYTTSTLCDSLQNIEDMPLWEWERLATFDGLGSKQLRIETITSAEQKGAIRIRFNFKSDPAWSDEDGIRNTDGAVIIDSLTVKDLFTVYEFEDFEDESPGDLATTDGDWECLTIPGYGDFAGLYSGMALVQEDPCKVNLTCLWAFINGSTDNYACGGWPVQTAVPYGNIYDQYIKNEIWSPQIEWTGGSYQAELQFDVYRDLPLDGLIFFVWHVRSVVNGCNLFWRDREYIYYGSEKDWHTVVEPIGDLIDPGASHIQVALGVLDMCEFWCDVYYSMPCHSHAPLFDNIKVYKMETMGPQWHVEDIHLFQDNFATDGTLTGTVRADMAADILPQDNPNILPGDSVVVTAIDPEYGIGTDPGGGPAVYCYAAVRPKYQPGKSGDALTQDGFRWPVVDSMIAGGNTWYCIRMDTVFEESGRVGPAANQFCVDLNDNLFTPGDTVFFFLKAKSGGPSNVTYWSEFTGTATDLAQVVGEPMEFTCLPVQPPPDYPCDGGILYVDDYDRLGAEPYIDDAIGCASFQYHDRFDVRGSASCVGNSPGGRVVDVSQQLIPRYRAIIWNSGDLSRGTIGDGTGFPEKANDFSVLYEFLDQHTSTYGAGVYISGDDIAQEWIGLSGGSAINFESTFMPYELVSGVHYFLHGLSPMVIGEPGSCFNWYDEYFDTLFVYGGCPDISDFDVLMPAGISTLEMTYNGTGLQTDGAVLSCETTNSLGNPARTLLSGFSFHYVRDSKSAYMARWLHMRRILECMHFCLPIDGCDAKDVPLWKNSLSQNFPNPFNPTTTIQYTIKEQAHVTLKIYDVAGRLVKTLVNSIKEPGVLHHVVWDGRSNTGDPVSSGVYFYKIVSKDFTKTKKMLLLK